MKWFRSNIRSGARLALFALAIQFLLSFGHFHGAQAASASSGAKRSALHVHYNTLHFAAARLDASNGASPAKASGATRSHPFDHAPDGQPGDDCAICAVMSLANAMVVATPPDLPAPQAGALLRLVAGAEFAEPGSARVAFQPRAPPIS
jgi:hypothetical protein